MSSFDHPTIAASIAISDNAMQCVWYLLPINFQREAIPCLIMMRCAHTTSKPLILVHGTDSIKIACTNNVYIRVLAYQLDYIKNKELADKLCTKLRSMKKGAIQQSSYTYYQSDFYAILVIPFFLFFISNGVMNLVCVDKIQICVMFGITFRK